MGRRNIVTTKKNYAKTLCDIFVLYMALYVRFCLSSYQSYILIYATKQNGVNTDNCWGKTRNNYPIKSIASRTLYRLH